MKAGTFFCSPHFNVIILTYTKEVSRKYELNELIVLKGYGFH